MQPLVSQHVTVSTLVCRRPTTVQCTQELRNQSRVIMHIHSPSLGQHGTLCELSILYNVYKITGEAISFFLNIKYRWY